MCIQAHAQLSIVRFEVTASWDEVSGNVQVNEKIQLSERVADLNLLLQSLPIKDAIVGNLTAKVNDQLIPIKLQQNENGLFEGNLSVDASNFELNFQIQNQQNLLEAPLIFMPLATASSDEKLFSATIKIPIQYYIKESFPAINDEAKVIGNQRIYHVSLPVITSMLRAEISKDDSFNFSTTKILDGVVLLTLATLGVIGWRKRKMLI